MYTCQINNSQTNSINSNHINIDLSKYKKINSKTNVELYKETSSNNDGYYIEFKIENNKYNLEQLIETSIINMLKEFNKDLVEDFIIQENENKDSGTIEIYLHSPNKDMGISKKFIKGVFSLKKENSIMNFTCKSVETNDSLVINNQKYKKITLENFEACIDCQNQHSCIFSIKFNINIHEDLPIYMLNMRGIMIAKICNNLKMFIEKM
jgi:hypothetical protein